MIKIVEPTVLAELNAVRDLMRAFIAWHRERHVQDLQLIDQYFDAAAFEDELRTLPGIYTPSRGHLLLASVQQEPAGCVVLRRSTTTNAR